MQSEPTIPVNVTKHFGEVAAENRALRFALEQVDGLLSRVMTVRNQHVFESVAALVTATLADAPRKRAEAQGVMVPERVLEIRDRYRGIAERIGNHGRDRTLNDINYLLGFIEHLVGYVDELAEGQEGSAADERA